MIVISVRNCVAIVAAVVSLQTSNLHGQNASARFNVRDEEGQPLPCRIHMFDAKGKPQRAEGQPYWNDHFVCAGRVDVSVRPGRYRYDIERGPEYERVTGELQVATDQSEAVNVTLKRFTNLRSQGWYSGDLHVHRPPSEIEPLMQAEDLDFAPVITWWNGRNYWKDRQLPAEVTRSFDGGRIYSLMAGEDEREGGALLYFGLRKPLDLSGSQRELPSPMRFVKNARAEDPDVWIDIEKPFWWDVPTWIATGKMNSIGLANNHMCRSRMLADEAWGRSRDTQRLPAPRGNGFWTQEIYYHLLNAGIRIPPSAGSASGVLPNPVGYNRVYVHLEQPLTRDAWFDGLRQGRCFVTNGPLLLAKAKGELPGATLTAGVGESVLFALEMKLATRDPVSQLEVIHNGEVSKRIVCKPQRMQQIAITLEIDEPGWFLVRAIADNQETFRFASTGPFFVEIEDKPPRISRESVQFFLDWIDQRMARVKRNVPNERDLRGVLEHHLDARVFWQKRLAMANVP